LLARYGVKAVSVGENGACAPVNVPPIFLWQDNTTNTEVIALFHPHGYGVSEKLMTGDAIEAENEGVQAGTGAHTLGTDFSDCVTVDAAGVALCYAWNSDNRGPHTATAAVQIFETVEKMHAVRLF
jgi:hypothetical protein